MWHPFKTRLTLRRSLVVMFAVFVAATFAPVLWTIWKGYYYFFPRLPIDPIELTEHVKAAIEKRLEFSTSMFQVALLLLAGMWGLVFSEKDRAYSILAERPEIAMLLMATAALASSFIAHFVFLWEMTSLLKSERLFNGLIPDIDNIDVSYALFSQMLTVLGGAVITATFVASGRWLKLQSDSEEHKT